MKIRCARKGDAYGLAALLRSLAADLPRFAAEPADATHARVEQALSNTEADCTLLIAESDSGIVGFIHTHWQPSLLHSGGEGFIAALFVHLFHRGQGVGQALLEQVKLEALKRGCSRLSLLNMRHRSSYERGFYAKLGWEERPEAANFIFKLRETR